MNYFKPRVLTLAATGLFFPAVALASSTTYTLPNPFGSSYSNPADIVVNIIQFALAFVGILALVMFMYGGFIILTAHGNAEQFKKGTHTLVYAVVGVAVVLTSYSVLNYLFVNVFNFTAS